MKKYLLLWSIFALALSPSLEAAAKNAPMQLKKSDKKKGLSGGAIAGITVGSVLGASALAAGGTYLAGKSGYGPLKSGKGINVYQYDPKSESDIINVGRPKGMNPDESLLRAPSSGLSSWIGGKKSPTSPVPKNPSDPYYMFASEPNLSQPNLEGGLI